MVDELGAEHLPGTDFLLGLNSMSLLATEKLIIEKFCFIPCPPSRCNCRNGNPELWALQQAKFAQTAKAAAQADETLEKANLD